MIVRDEAQTIQRCLRSVTPFIGSWVIHDLGSTDKTPELALAELEHIPGKIEHHEFDGFDHARTRLIQSASKNADWVLMLDADEEFHCFSSELALPDSEKAGLLNIETNAYTLRQVRLFKSDLEPLFSPAVYESPMIDDSQCTLIKDCWIQHHCDGVRHQNSDRVESDLNVLLQSTAPNHYALAQAYLAMNELALAQQHFHSSLAVNPSANQNWFSHYVLAAIEQRLGNNPQATKHYQECLQIAPERIEASIRLAELLFHSDDLDRAQEICQATLNAEPSDTAHYFEPMVYSYKNKLLMAVIWAENERTQQARSLVSELKQQNLEPNDQQTLQKVQMLIDEPDAQIDPANGSTQLQTQKPTPTADPTSAPKLTVGMATHDDFHGVYFTIISIILYHKEVLDQIEILVVDNNPDSEHGQAVKGLCNRIKIARYIRAAEYKGTAIRERVLEEARGEYVLCADCHVFLHSGALQRLLDYFEQHPQSNDLIHGPLFYDNHESYSTHMDPIWRKGFYGTWGSDSRGKDIDGEAFDIPLQGMGLFACRRDAWPGFNLRFRGFGGEEGYIHEKFRQHGGRVLCLPFLRWTHRFDRPGGAQYENKWEHRIRNYLLGWDELGLETSSLLEHFSEVLNKNAVAKVNADFLIERRSPFWGRDTIYCLAEDDNDWQKAQYLFHQLGIKNIVQKVDNKTQLTQLSLQAQTLKRNEIIVFNAHQLDFINAKELQAWAAELEQKPTWHSLPAAREHSIPKTQYAALYLPNQQLTEYSNNLNLTEQSKNKLTYVIGYWLDPASAPEREAALRTYFDLQKHTKQQLGAEQIIVTNIDYEGALTLKIPEGFTPRHAQFSKHLAVYQLLQSGIDLPICVHDHDLFLKQELQADPHAIRCGSKYSGIFSDQILVIPPSAREEIMAYYQQLFELELPFHTQSGYGTEQRHEGLYSTEMALRLMQQFPFKDVPIVDDILCYDLVSHEIQEHHSLDNGNCEAQPVPEYAQVVHGHLNKGQATEVLVDWLSA